MMVGCFMATIGTAQSPDQPSTWRRFTVEQRDGAVTRMTPMPCTDADMPRWAQDVSQQTSDWTDSPSSDATASGNKAFVAHPIPYVIAPTDDSEPFHSHNHCPSITWLPNGDLLAVWYSTQREVGTELTVLASRLRAGQSTWDASSEFFKCPDHNMHGSSVFQDGQGTIYHFNGMGAEGIEGWDNLALLMRTSEDNGLTWSSPLAVDPQFRHRNQVISGTLLTERGTLVQLCDAVPGGEGGTAAHISSDQGRTWNDPGAGKQKPQFVSGGTGEGTIAGIHAKMVELSDGRWMAMGRGDSIDGRMPKSISADQGKTWTYSASVFPPIGSGQRLVLRRLNEGPLLLVSFTADDRKHPESGEMDFTDAAGQKYTGRGMYAALSFDDGETWPVRKLLTPGEGDFNGGAWTQKFTATPTNAEHAGYLAATQSPDNVIHLISSRLYYRFNLDWLREPAVKSSLRR